MFIPIGDDNPTEKTPYVNYALIGLNTLAFLLFCLGPGDDPRLIRWTMIPANLEWPTLFTSMFLHAGWFHLIGNMLFLWIFGDNVEDKLGHVGYAVFYLVCGLGASAAHVLSEPNSQVPTLGASGAISGVMGAYIVFFPRHHVKTFIWLGILYADVVRIPAFIWVGIWIVEQIVLNALAPPGGGGGVAYLAHIGGFGAGAVIAGATLLVLKHLPSASRKREADLDAKASDRRIFQATDRDHGIEFVDDSGDGYSVLRLRDVPDDVAPISTVVAAVTGESAFDVVDRLVVTRGMIARSIPRDSAARIQRDLHTAGIPAAIILHNRSNFPPVPTVVDSASWDDRVMRFRAGDQVVTVPWSGPILYVGARVNGAAFIDVFVNRKTAYRIKDLRAVALRRIGPDGRTESPTDLGGFASSVVVKAAGTGINEGIRTAAEGGIGARLDFRTPQDYDDYIFWLYNLTLAQGPQR
jgi:membrane associated rhomboid family serine protease